MQHGTRYSYKKGCRCEVCRGHERQAESERYLRDKEKRLAQAAAYKAAHREQTLAAAAAYRDAHKEEIRAWREAHKAEAKAYRAAYRLAHLEDERARDHAHREERMAKCHRRRALLAGVESEKFTLADVIDRDGWRCGICGKAVKPGSKGRDRPSLDHVVPISQGGPHTMANAQLAHFGCNSGKRERYVGATQLRLLG